MLSDQVWWCHIKRFLSYSKNYTWNLCKPIHDITNYSTSVCPFESGKCGKEDEKLQITWIHQEWKELFRWNKKHFSVFEGLSFGEKNKNLIKNSRRNL